MMSIEHWEVIIGALLISVALIGSFFRRLPVSTTMLYFAAGVGIGPIGFGLVYIDPVEQTALLEELSAIAVVVSLFTAGLKMRVPLRHPRWRPPVRLAFVSMACTVGLVALALVAFLDVSWGAAVLVGAILAPTDPVLASEVQMRRAGDRDQLRVNLTAEAGMNDGTAFPFVMLGLGLLGLHEMGEYAWRWFAVDLFWAIAAGLGIGALLGTVVGELVVHLRRKHSGSVGFEEFLALGLISLSYGGALLIHAYGFLAVFAAGVALRAVERRHSERVLRDHGHAAETQDEEVPEVPEPDDAPAHMTETVLSFNEQVERLAEVALVLCLGVMLSPEHLPAAALWFIPLLLLVLRPISVLVGLAGSGVNKRQQALISWLGIRGIGSFYYLMYVIGHGLSESFSRQLVSLVVLTIAVSIFVHGVTTRPLMAWASRKGS